MFLKIELMFRNNQRDLLGKFNVKKMFIDNAASITKAFKLPSNCHNTKNKLVLNSIHTR